MCGVCGCSEHETSELIKIENDILSVNNSYAKQNNKHFNQHRCLALNLVSSPGAGKTTILEKTISSLQSKCNMAVIEGDQYTDNDALRIKKAGVSAIQINTGKSCHLDAHRVGHAYEQLDFNDGILFIENVGNLVCPALFDMGEHVRVVILSVTEGDDKPIKYQEMFASSDIVVFNKIDLLPYVDFNIKKASDDIKKLSPKAKLFSCSATSGEGLTTWCDWLLSQYTENFKKDTKVLSN
jgi:hydrogenase nickel incorporation protein HypB